MKSNSLHYYMLKSYACSICVLLILLFFTLPACSHQSEEIVPTTSVETTEILITETTEIPIAETQPLDLEQESISERCAEIMAVYYDTYMAAEKTAHDDYWKTQVLSPRSIDAIENILIEEGFDVMDSNGYYPAYLTTPAKFYNFWESVQSGESAEQEIITVTEQGNLFYTLLRYSSGTCFAYFMNCGFESDGSIEVTFFECHTVKDMELTDKGNFYYRIYPADDKHYADYSLVRLAPPDLELYDMTRKYIIPVNYVGVNLFLCDWSETDYGELSVNDLWEYIYYASYGEQFASVHAYRADWHGYEIPAADFEEIVMPYFNIDIEEFRELALYDSEKDCYPWRPLETNDFVHLWYYTCEPEVTACRNNPDGTITLTVEVLSTDLKMDCLFAHEVTIRPLENGRFQYVGNKITYQTEYGLPYSKARLLWD